jgi:protein SCO1
MKKLLWYGLGFIVLLVAFYYFLFAGTDYYQSKLPVLSNVQPFSFTDQNGQKVNNHTLQGKVYVTEYFFTTCSGICPKMNANMEKIYSQFKDDDGFAVLSHTCMPETDSVPRLKAYEKKMLGDEQRATSNDQLTWYFVTGSKDSLYRMARESYLLDNDKNNSINIKDQFIHTQFFALVDKQQRVRGIYDGLKQPELEALTTDIKSLLKEHGNNSSFNHSTFSNNPN